MRSIGLIAKHIDIYWDERYKGKKPHGSGNPEDTILSLIKISVELIISSHDLNVLHKSYDEKTLKELYDSLTIEIENLKTSVKFEIKKSSVKRDKQNLQILLSVLDDINATQQHIQEKYNKIESISRFRTELANTCNGSCIIHFSQGLHPLFGKTNEKEEGFCQGLIYAWSHKKNISDALVEQYKTYTKNEKKGWTQFHVCSGEGKEINTLESTVSNFNFEENTTYLLRLKRADGIGHALGMRKCNGISEYEVFDPNLGIFRFRTTKDASKFFNLLIKHYKESFNENFNKFYIHKINKKYEGTDNPSLNTHTTKPTISFIHPNVKKDTLIDGFEPGHIIYSI